MYVVAGATGNTGSVAADTLLAEGKQVTVIVRSAEKGEPWRAKGAKVAVSNLDETAKVREILAGAEGVYLLIPPNPEVHQLHGETGAAWHKQWLKRCAKARFRTWC